ncbi:hypothetical protein Sru01_54470 [Sphaerisporangium rufum]|uniref:Penicillin amidase n=1 Tax=Sphaerisporangium rufum TaxID=1381558 RepID=A0A919RAP7_9ACTN|nr:penicillin acylase family protein [Sphaerisporangium rufum]GII80465.1 hypothetical protein Sru01_54470 [Sphaerisporangium rufum]
MTIRTYRDPWGIPHLRAGDHRELAFAQGRNAARDRAWQIEVERHRAGGTSAAFLGPSAAAWDVFARRARLADTARRCFRTLDPDTASWVGAYVDGVNAGLPCGARRAPEFAATGLAPGRWAPCTPLAVWLAHHILFAGFPGKLWRDTVARRLGPGAAELFATEGPGPAGSNGWLVSGARTATGAALLAGDPHRFIEDPGVYQQIRLTCPRYDVIGLAVPGVPGIPHFGHAGPVAWAITNAMADYQDLYHERLRRRGAGVQALGPDGWRPVAVSVEVVEVAGGDPVPVEVIETGRGPVVSGGPDGEGAAVSLRYPPRVYRELGFAALPALLRARSVADVDRALAGWVEPVNVVLAADTAGGLLHRVAGVVPVRHPDNSRWVVPAWEPGHEWRGRHAPMPRAPVDGVAVMANERGLAAPLGVDFAPPHRARRIRELLAAAPAWSAGAMAAVHTDTHLGSAEPLVALVAAAAPAGRLRDLIVGWDRRMDAGSAGAGAYAAVRSALVRRLAAHPALAPLAAPSGHPEVFAPWLDLVSRVGFALPGLLATGPPGHRADLPGLVRAAVAEAADTGTEPWGRTHRLAPWSALPGAATGEGPGLSGDHDCVLATSSVPGVTDRCARGPAARYVWDLARRDGSRWVVPLGASGVPGDPHRYDQLPHWLRGELIPVTCDRRLLTEERDDG